MIPAFRVKPVALLAAVPLTALAVTTAACGSSASSAGTAVRTAATSTAATGSAATGSAAAGQPTATGSSSPAAVPTGTAASAATGPAATSAAAGGQQVTGAAASALVAKAVTGTKAAASVRVTGQGTSNGKPVTFDITMVRGQGCAGTLATSSTQTFQVVETGGWTWLKPTAAFYQSLHLSKAAAALLEGKYIKVKSDNKQISDLTKLCTLNGLFGGMNLPAQKNFTATPSTYDGQPAYRLTQPGKPGYAYISSGQTPQLLKLAANGATIRFTDYNAMHSISKPPAAETIDGSQLGF